MQINYFLSLSHTFLFLQIGFESYQLQPFPGQSALEVSKNTIIITGLSIADQSNGNFFAYLPR